MQKISKLSQWLMPVEMGQDQHDDDAKVLEYVPLSH
jgi:hypothetical protein